MIEAIKFISSLEKLYDNDKLPESDYKKFSMLRNEKKSFQLVVISDEKSTEEIKFSSNIKTVHTYKVEHIKSDLPMTKNDADNYYRFSESGYYPDLLLPIDNKVQLKSGINVIWIEIDANGTSPNNYTFVAEIGNRVATLEVEIIDAELDFNNFIYTNWFHTDCLMSYYNFEAFSKEYWKVAENFLKTASEYGMNCVLTPIFTPPLDTEIGKERPTVQLVDVMIDNNHYIFNFDKLTQWIEMSQKCGIEYFELSHFYTQWGANHTPKIMATVNGEYKKIFGWETKANSKEYKNFLKCFSIELKKYLKSKNLEDKVFIHVSDEPNLYMLRNYAKASKYIHKLFKGYKIIDALSDIWFYRLKIVSNPIPANDHIDKFIGKVDNLWTYYCSAQKKHCVSNRFFCNESIRTRILGYQLYKFNIKGFLHWGYNFYYTQLSKGLINPFEVSDAGGNFPSGDSYIVYPNDDGTALHSIRLKVFYDGLQDMAALNTLEKLTNKNCCLEIIDKDIKPLTFREYPHDNLWLLKTREEINSKIKANIR